MDPLTPQMISNSMIFPVAIALRDPSFHVLAFSKFPDIPYTMFSVLLQSRVSFFFRAAFNVYAFTQAENVNE